MKLRLGKKPVKHDNRNLKFSHYLVKDELPRLYDHERWGQKIKYWRMMKNDVLQNCGITAAAHAVMLWTSDTNCCGIPAFISNKDVVKAYIGVTGMSGAPYNPRTGENDNGVYMLDALNYWRKKGIGKHKINAFVEIDKDNVNHAKYAVRLFGQAYVGLQLPWSAAEQYQDGVYWSVPSTGDQGDGAVGSWGGHAVCLSGDTKVSLLDGRELTMKELTDNHAEGNFWVYSCDENGNIVPGIAHSPRKTGELRKTLKITLDNKETFSCTEDHLILMRDGTYKKACELKPKDSLMPLHRRKSEGKDMKGYEETLNVNDRKWYFTHRVVAQNYYGDYKGVVHHKDFNKENNSPNNLEIMSWQNHTKLHAELAKPENLLNYAKSDKGRETSRNLMKGLWANEEWRLKMSKIQSENGKKVNKRLLEEGKHFLKNISFETRSEMGRKHGAVNIVNTHTQEAINKRVKTTKNKFQTDPEFRNKKTQIAIQNISKHNESKKEPTRKQRLARRENALRLNYNRFNKDKYLNFEEYLDRNNIKLVNDNHEILSIEDGEITDVYDLTVDKYHNFALSCGVFVHNCVVGYDKDGFTIVTWDKLWHISYKFFEFYCDEIYTELSPDWFKEGKAPNGFDVDKLEKDLQVLKK